MSDNTQTSQAIIDAQTLDEIYNYVKSFVSAGITVILEGAPGAGKTSMANQLAKDIDHQFVSIVTSTFDYAEISGIPDVSGDIAVFKPFGVFNTIYNAIEPTLVLLDDLGQAHPQTQAALMQLIHDRCLNGQIVPECVKFVIATNRRKDKGGVHGIISPIRNRATTIPFVSKCTCTRDSYCSWHRWAINNEIHPAVAAFARFRPFAMAEYDENIVDRESAVCSARTLEFLSKLEIAGLPEPHKHVIEYTIGRRYGAEYLAFRQLYHTMPMYGEIVTNPTSAYVPTDDKVSECIAITTMLAHLSKFEDLDAIAVYIGRLGMELSTACMTMLEGKYPEIKETAGYTKWSLANAKNHSLPNKY